MNFGSYLGIVLYLSEKVCASSVELPFFSRIVAEQRIYRARSTWQLWPQYRVLNIYKNHNLILNWKHEYLVYFFISIFSSSHITRTTTWEDPRKSLAAQTAAQHQSAEQLLSPHQTPSPTTTSKISYYAIYTASLSVNLKTRKKLFGSRLSGPLSLLGRKLTGQLV